MFPMAKSQGYATVVVKQGLYLRQEIAGVFLLTVKIFSISRRTKYYPAGGAVSGATNSCRAAGFARIGR